MIRCKIATGLLFILLTAVLGQGPLGEFTEPAGYYGEVYKYQLQHTKIVQVAVEPSNMYSPPPRLQDVVYFSNDIDSQFYLQSQTGYVLVDAVELVVGNYTFIANANFTANGQSVESLAVNVTVRVLPEFYFAGTEEDGGYLAYVSTDLYAGAEVTRIIPQFTLLHETTFNCSIDEIQGSGSFSAVTLLSSSSLVLDNTSADAGVQQFIIICLAINPSSVVIETLRENVTIVFYQISDLVASDLTFNPASGLIRWSPPLANNIDVSNSYQNLLTLINYEIRIAVNNGDESYFDGAKNLSSSTNSYTYQPLIPQTNLGITLTTVYVRGISMSLTVGANTGGNALQPPQSVNISSGSVNGTLTITWQSPSTQPVNVTGYIIRLSYTARQAHRNESVFREVIGNQSNNSLSYEFNHLPGNTLYDVVVVALYSNGQRVPTSPVQHTLPGYAPSDSPNITEVKFIPDSTIRIDWSTVFFSNGEITYYTIYISLSNDNTSLNRTGNTTSYTKGTLGQSNFVDVDIQAANLYGNSPRSMPKRIFTNGAPVNVTVENITDTSACFTWSPPPDANPFYYDVFINGDPVARVGTGQTTYCKTQIASDSFSRVNIQATYASSFTFTSASVMFHTVQAPQNFIAFSPTNISVMLEWTPPEPVNAMEQNIRVVRYELCVALLEFPDTFNVYPVNGTGMNSSVFENFLQPGMTYSVALVAVFSNNARATSSPASFTTLVNVPPNVAPRNLHILSYNTTTTVAIFQWDPIFFSNGPITGYKFYIGDNDGISIQGASNTTYNAELNITSNIQVSVSVAAVNSAGESVPAAEVISLNAAPGALRTFLLNASSVRLFWDPPALVIVDFLHYLLNVFIDGIPVDSVMVNANSFVYNNLYSASVYSFQVAAVYPSTEFHSNVVSVETAAICDSPCPFGGECIAEPDTCDCTSLLTGGTDECYGGRANASCSCSCYYGLFTGENCTESSYGPMVLLEPSMYGVMVTIVPPTPAVSTADIVDYQLMISGPPTDQEYTVSDMRSVLLNISVENYPYAVASQMRFRISEHHNDFLFIAPSNIVTLMLYECGPGMYGGFNSTDCQLCPDNSGNLRGYNYVVENCGCSEGYTGQNGGPCIACDKGTFKPENGSDICQECPFGMSSEVGSPLCSCDSGYEPIIMQCRACMESFYKDKIENTTCTPCPQFSDVSDTGSNALSNCTCTLSSGNAEQGCYAFESKANVQVPSDREVSNSWVVVSWDPLTSVVDRNGNLQGAVAGFFVTYQLIRTKRIAVEGDAINITNGTMTSVNITGLQQGSQYEVVVSPYIEGFQLGPPTIIAINTLPLDDVNTTMIAMTSAASATITITPTAGTTDDGNDEGLSTIIIIIIAVVAGGATAVILLIMCCICCVVYRRRRHGKTTISTSTKNLTDKNGSSLSPVFKKVSTGDHEMVVQNPSFVESGKSNEKEHVFDVTKDTTECLYENTVRKPEHSSSENYYVQEKQQLDSANDVYEIERLATPDDYNNEALYEEMTARYYDISKSNQTILNELSRNKVTLLEQLGKGEFGRVMKGVASGIIPGESDTVVAVKLLKEGASSDDKKNFLGEANLLSKFNHPNVLSLLGVITVDEPVLVVIPFMKNGDLQSFLTKNSESADLTYHNKLDIALQIANGMEYLAARFFIHRDLAARNVLVGDKLHVKISDFGMSRVLAQDDTYYKLSSTAKLPVKWMALESIEYRKFSTFSDVWSYGVVLWEIFSLGMRPYKGVPGASMPTYLRSGKRLAKPANCTDEIYQLMMQCWMEQKEMRPTFNKIIKDITKLLQ